MTNGLARLEAVESATDRRREPRHPARASARLSSSRGESAVAALSDVSTHGCAVSLEQPWLRSGAFVSIAIAQEQGLEAPPMQAIVRWVREGSAGMEFLAPIPADRTEWHDLMA
jgi:hypothetical protein